MVVLEGGGMLSTSGNQYLQPDYLSPLATTLDAKKSPLALLAQTCSQIGSDSSNAKTTISALDKSKKSDGASRSPLAVTTLKPDKSRVSPSEVKLAFKPYETNVLTKKSDERPPSKSNSVNNNESSDDKKIGSHTPSRKSTSPASTPVNESGKTSPSASGDRKTVSPAGSAGRGASPIIRSGLEVLQGHPKDIPLGTYKPSSSINPLTGLCCPPGMEQHANPAFRPPFAGSFAHHHAAMLAAAGYPGANPGPYVSYARVKTPSGGEALVPVCKDPYCTGCQFSAHSQQMMMGGGPCPSGCTQCDHQKYGLAMAMSLSQSGPIPPSLNYPQLGRPYVCNWIAGDSYCGKRFGASEELLQHLRTHTSMSSEAAAAAAAAVATSQASLLSPLGSLFSPAALHRGYSAPQLSPLSAARYHPYAKPGMPTTLPGTLPGSPYSAFNPALSAYYSPYAMYGQRLGAAAHP